MMLAKIFYNVISEETKAVAFLRTNGLSDYEEIAAVGNGMKLKEK